MPTYPEAAHESRRRAKSNVLSSESYASVDRRDRTKDGQQPYRYTAPESTLSHDNRYHQKSNSAGKQGRPTSERPRLSTRTLSAPLVRQTAGSSPQTRTPHDLDEDHVEPLTPEEAQNFAQAEVGALDLGQDADEVAGAVGSFVRNSQPFSNFEVSESLPDINIAVVGAKGVGKTTFLQRALGLPYVPSTPVAERKIPINGRIHLVRLFELPLDDVDIDDSDAVEWPDTIANKIMPKINGALTLYNVNDKSSLESVPEILNAINKASLPSILIACQCDTPARDREIDPWAIETQAKRRVNNLGTLQTSEKSPESFSQAISSILRGVIAKSPDQHKSSPPPTRKRAQSTASQPLSPKTSSVGGHSRASSEYTGIMNKDVKHSRHDSSIAAYGSSDKLRSPREMSPDEEEMQGSFLLEESGSERTTSSAGSTTSIEMLQHHMGTTSLSTTSLESGSSFPELITRLLAQPTSKADSKFAAIFLALYRNFAAPGRLLEAIVERYDGAERDGSAQMLTTVTQLRYLSILEQWIGCYPGDFAHPKTQKRMKVFVHKIAQRRIYNVAAKEMSAHLEMVQEDDDTNWGFSDKDREAESPSKSLNSPTSKALFGDPASLLNGDVNGRMTNGDMSPVSSPGGTVRSSSGSTTSSQILLNVEAAQKQSQLLQPIPRNPITKIMWRELMDQPDERVARELTRIDWIMFSSVRPRDMVRHVSLRRDEKLKCKNLVHVTRMVEHFNQLACWVTNFVLLRDKPKHRALMLEKFMRVARRLREMNNYNALGAIIAGIKSSAVHRLGATKELIPPNVGKDWLKLEILMAPSRSHAAYRLAWENSSTERIPYLPLHCRDLVSAAEGNKTFAGDEKDGKINWKKFEVMGEVILSMQRAQGMPYKGLGGSRGDQQIKELVLDVKLEKDEDILYERSLHCEPPVNPNGPSQKFKEFFKR